MSRLVGRVGRRWLACAILWGLGLILLPQGVQAADPVVTLAVSHTDTGVHVDFDTSFELSPAVEAALQKGLALNFVAEAQVFRERWYWRDQRVARASKTWRLTYQPLTRQYRVNVGGQTQNFDAFSEALAALQHVSRWTVAEPAELATSGSYRMLFTYQLDTSHLALPMQIGVGGQTDWALFIQKKVSLPPVTGAKAE